MINRKREEKMRKSIILSIIGFVFFASFVSADLAGNAIALDGLNDFVRIPDAPQFGGMSSLTVEAWFMPYNTSRDNPIFYKGDGVNIRTDRSYDLWLLPHTSSWAVFTGTDGWTWLYGSTPPPVSVNQWTHLAATYDSIKGVASIYFNGDLFLTTTTDAVESPISGLVRDSSEDLILGAFLENMYHGSVFSFGLMDEVRIWNYARSTSQITSNFNKLVNPSENGLIGYWNFDESFQNPYVYDLSSYGNSGTLGSSLSIEASDPTRVISTAPIIPEPCTILLLWLGGLLIRKQK
jgi:hypothetical protein